MRPARTFEVAQSVLDDAARVGDRIARLIDMGATSVELTDGVGSPREVRIEHPELPGLLAFPIHWTLARLGEDDILDRIIERLASALADERNTPHDE